MTLNKKSLVISAGFGIIILFLAGLIIYPLFKDVKRISGELVKLKKDLFLSQDKVKNLEQIRKDYQDLKPDLDKIERLFADPEVPINLIQFWEKTAIDAGVQIIISPASLKPSDSDPWKSIGFQITLIGPFSGFLKFLEKIENASYLIEIQNLVVNKLTKQEVESTKYRSFSPGDVRVTMLTKVFTK